jgi:hypothetical protein
MNRMINSITEMLRRADGTATSFPPTLLFEEGWMLRLVLQWFAESRNHGHPLSFATDARWYSEALLASAFLARHRGDPLAEGLTHADGVVGHFSIGDAGQADLNLRPNTRQFVVVEAKMFSALSRGTTRAPTYNQAARNVACMAELMRRAALDPASTHAAFFVLAPREQIDAGVFGDLLDAAKLRSVVEERTSMYDPPLTEWFENHFVPALDSIRTDCLAWEDVIAHIGQADAAFGDELREFYMKCLKFNRPRRGGSKQS